MELRRRVLLLPGQGAQRERMAAGLYGERAEFTGAMDAFFARLGAYGPPLRTAWLREAPNPAMDDAAVAQPLLLAVGYALGRSVSAAAGGPDLLLGHSVGELAAACLAGVFDAADVGGLAAARSRVLRDDAGRGGMLAVAGGPHELSPALGPGVAIAALNGPRQTVLAGPAEELTDTAERLRASGRIVRALRSDQAFHSPAMAGTALRFGAALAAFGPRAPRAGITVISSRTGAPLTVREARDPHFWAVSWPPRCGVTGPPWSGCWPPGGGGRVCCCSTVRRTAARAPPPGATPRYGRAPARSFPLLARAPGTACRPARRSGPSP
ncbi:hypothetical protein SBADM41S_09665 [Streptomyces badius]